MGFTSSRKQAILELVTTLKTDDPAELERLVASFKRVETSAKGANEQLIESRRKFVRVSDETISQLRQEEAARQAVNRTVTHSGATYQRVTETALKAAREEAEAQERVALAYQRAARAKLPSGTSAVGTGVRVGGGKASGTLAALGSILPGQGGDIARAAGNLSRLTEQITQLSQSTGVAYSSVGKAAPALAALNTPIAALGAGAVAGVALAALALAIEQFVKGLKEAQENLSNAYDAQVEYYRLIKTGTSEEIKDKLDALKIEVEARQLANRDLIQATERAVAALGPFKDIVIQIAQALKIGSFKEINDSNKEIQNFNLQINALTAALGSNEVKTRDAAKAAEEAAAEAAKQAKETDKATASVERATKAQEELAQTADQLAIFYDNLNARQAQTADAIKQAEFKLAEDRLRLFASYAQRIEDQERQNQRNLAREQRRADFDRLIALKQRELSEFDLLLRGDFAGVARLRREAQAQDEIDRFRGEFEANERLIAQREQDFDNQLDLQRQIAELTKRTHQERLQAQQSDYAFMRSQVQEWFKLKGLMGDVSRLTDAQILKFYNLIASVAGAPRTTFGAPLGGGSVAPAAVSVGRPSIGQPGLGSGFAATGGFTPSGTTVNATFNITGNDTRAIARAVDERLRRVVGG